MNTGTKLLLAAGAIVAFSAFQKAQAGGTLNFYPASVKNISFDGVTPVAVLGIAIQNPSGQRFVVNSIVGNLYANDYLIGNVSSYGKMIVEPNKQAVYNVNVRLSILGIVNDIINAFQTKSGINQDLEFAAYVNVNNFSVPVKIKYKVP